MRAVTGNDNGRVKSTGRTAMLAGLAVTLALSVTLAFWLTSRTVDDPPDLPPVTKQSARLERGYGQKWRALGVTHWEYSASSSTTFYVNSVAWEKLTVRRREEIMKALWLDIKKVSPPREPDEPDISIMIHDELRRMRAAYVEKEGMISY